MVRDRRKMSGVSLFHSSPLLFQAEAVESSYAVIVCVSPEYKQSGNCRMEAKYANDRFKKGKLKLIYVMMNEKYHTRSSPESVDGWYQVNFTNTLLCICDAFHSVCFLFLF